jgi:hypothetical protein
MPSCAFMSSSICHCFKSVLNILISYHYVWKRLSAKKPQTKQQKTGHSLILIHANKDRLASNVFIEECHLTNVGDWFLAVYMKRHFFVSYYVSKMIPSPSTNWSYIWFILVTLKSRNTCIALKVVEDLKIVFATFGTVELNTWSFSL